MVATCSFLRPITSKLYSNIFCFKEIVIHFNGFSEICLRGPRSVSRTQPQTGTKMMLRTFSVGINHMKMLRNRVISAEFDHSVLLTELTMALLYGSTWYDCYFSVIAKLTQNIILLRTHVPEAILFRFPPFPRIHFMDEYRFSPYFYKY